jgi:uncharacterized protein
LKRSSVSATDSSSNSTRRQFLKFLGAGVTAVCAAGLGPLAAATDPASPFLPFTPILPTTTDDLVLPEGFAYGVLARWGDPLPGTSAHFGYNPDFTAFLPTPGGREGVLFVNHEYVSLPQPDVTHLVVNFFRYSIRAKRRA